MDTSQITIVTCSTLCITFGSGWLIEKLLRLRLQKEFRQLRETTNDEPPTS